jgi:hypothetical protein
VGDPILLFTSTTAKLLFNICSNPSQHLNVLHSLSSMAIGVVRSLLPPQDVLVCLQLLFRSVACSTRNLGSYCLQTAVMACYLASQYAYCRSYCHHPVCWDIIHSARDRTGLQHISKQPHNCFMQQTCVFMLLVPATCLFHNLLVFPLGDWYAPTILTSPQSYYIAVVCPFLSPLQFKLMS